MLLSGILVSFEKVYVKITEQMQIYIENIRNLKKNYHQESQFFFGFSSGRYNISVNTFQPVFIL